MTSNFKIVDRPIGDLLPAIRNPRTHSRKQVRKLADAIERFDVVLPLLVRGDPPRIVAGHGRWQAAKMLGRPTVPTLSLDHLNVEEARAYAIADNQLATLAGWDQELLALELAEVAIAMPEIDLTVTGFEVEQIEILITRLVCTILCRAVAMALWIRPLRKMAAVRRCWVKKGTLLGTTRS